MLPSIYAFLALFALSGVSAHSCNCGGRSYSNDEIFGAIKMANKIDEAARQPDGKFPHRYANPDGVVYPFCSSGSKAEYPLMKIPPGPYKSGDPGPDRAIYLVGTRKIFCGCMTLAGYPRNAEDYVLCENFDV